LQFSFQSKSTHVSSTVFGVEFPQAGICFIIPEETAGGKRDKVKKHSSQIQFP
jgi:hypothetical protein